MKTKITFLITLLIGFMSNAQSIEKFSIDSGGASASAGGIQILYTIGEVNVAERTSASVSLSEGFINSIQVSIKIDPIVFLQGPLLNPSIAGLMNDILREDNHLPLTSPYSDALVAEASVFNKGGTSGVGSPDDDIVDWIWVELRSDGDSSNIIASKSALLQRDGDVVGIDGLSDVVLPVSPNSYYISIKHRNHLGIMTASSIALSDITTTVDFTDFNNQITNGTYAQTTFGVPTGFIAMWAGDVNGNGQVRYLGPSNDTNGIKDNVLNPTNGNPSGSNFYPYTGYDNADINMNGQIRYLGPGNDTNTLKDIVLSHLANTTFSNFFPILAQIPN